MNLHGDLAESWEAPDALTYVFRLKKGREISRWAGGDIERRPNDDRLHDEPGEQVAKEWFLLKDRLDRSARRLHGGFSPKGTVRVVSMEPREIGGGCLRMRAAARGEKSLCLLRVGTSFWQAIRRGRLRPLLARLRSDRQGWLLRGRDTSGRRGVPQSSTARNRWSHRRPGSAGYDRQVA